MKKLASRRPQVRVDAIKALSSELSEIIPDSWEYDYKAPGEGEPPKVQMFPLVLDDPTSTSKTANVKEISVSPTSIPPSASSDDDKETSDDDKEEETSDGDESTTAPTHVAKPVQQPPDLMFKVVYDSWLRQ